MKKSDVNFESVVASIKNRVAVKDYFFEKLPKDVRSLAFTVSNLETLRQVEMVQQSLANAITEGQSFKQWRDNLDQEAVRNLSAARLETVYRTNVHNVYNQATRYNASTSDVTPYLMYDAVGDSRTRPEHLELDGTTKKADSSFWNKYTPPLGYNCTASHQKVSGKFTKAFRSFYKGDMVRIKLESGKTISGLTVNHPVASKIGWIFAKDIKPGDELLSQDSEIRIMGSGKINNNDLNPSSSNLFKAMASHAFSFTKSTSFDFYGDIKFMNKEVDVVIGDGFLSGNGEDGVYNTEDFILKSSDDIPGYIKFFGLGKAFSSIKLNALFLKNVFNMTSRNKKPFSYFVGAQSVFVEILHIANEAVLVFSEKFLTRSRPWFEASTLESSGNRISTNAELLAKLEYTKSLSVKVDNVVDVQFYPYFGRVFDFESIHGVVITAGVLTGNCRCGIIPLSKEDAKEMGISRKSESSFPEPEFGNSRMGDINTQVSKATEEAIADMDKSPLKAKFKEAQNNVQGLVDIWYAKNKTKFEG